MTRVLYLRPYFATQPRRLACSGVIKDSGAGIVMPPEDPERTAELVNVHLTNSDWIDSAQSAAATPKPWGIRPGSSIHLIPRNSPPGGGVRLCLLELTRLG